MTMTLQGPILLIMYYVLLRWRRSLRKTNNTYGSWQESHGNTTLISPVSSKTRLAAGTSSSSLLSLSRVRETLGKLTNTRDTVVYEYVSFG